MTKINKKSDLQETDYNDEIIQSNLKNISHKHGTLKYSTRLENTIFLGIIFIFILASAVFLIPSPLRDVILSTNNQNVNNYDLPKVCDILDSSMAQNIIGEPVAPKSLTLPSTSVINCTYSNLSKTIGVSLISRKHQNKQIAGERFEFQKLDLKNDEPYFGIYKEVQYIIVLKKNEFIIQKNNFHYIFNYIGMKDLEESKVISDVETIINKI
jgi:hypothetical protein